MADFKPTKIDISTINNGKGKYNNGDGVQADTINAVVEGTAWVQALGTNQPNNSEAGNVGTPRVSIETLSDGTPRFKFDNLNSNYVNSPVETGASLSGQNTLANAVVPFKVESKNLFNCQATPDILSATTITSSTSSSVVVSATDDTSNFAYAAWKLNITSGKVTAQASWTNTGVGAKGTAYLYWNENNIFTKVAGQINYSGRTVTIDVIPPSDGAELYLILYVRINSPTPTAGDYVTYTNVQVEIGDTSTPYSPYVADGTVAQVVACGKNLIPFPYYQGGAGTVVTSNGVTMTVNSDGTITCAGTATGDVRFYFTNLVPSGIPNIGLKGGQTYWLSKRCVVSYKTSPDGEILGFFGFDAGTTFIWQDNYILVNVRLQFGTGTETNYTISPIIAITEDEEIPYEPYNGQTYSTEVGASVEITQRDKYTTIYAETDGVTVSGQFILSTQYELNDKLTPLFGTFANRPTTTQPYTIMYIATDQTGDNKVTILPANTDGSVSGNWITI